MIYLRNTSKVVTSRVRGLYFVFVTYLTRNTRPDITKALEAFA